MPLAAGTRVGAYEITGVLGAGGMGEVYRAHDRKLDRDVALKILPAAVAGDEERLARFRREAQLLASLNHPNIAHVHGFEDTGPTSAFVMELVEGPTLADVIHQRGALPLDDALPIARQIADALEAAHERGIIHRDLKPANIKVRDDGTVKVLDFGLAKALDPMEREASAERPSSSMSPTLTARGTQLGVILGTAAYMAPEQAKGKPVDRRADIWAFGLVLYEMLAGRRAYGGEDVSDTLAAVLMREADWTALPPSVPPKVHTLLRDCLVRDPRQRLRDIGEARRVIDQIISGAPEPPVSAPTPSPAPRGRSWLVPWAIAAVGVASAVALSFVHFSEAPAAPPLVRFYVAPPQKSSIGAFALSPDGRNLAFAASDGSIFGVAQTGKVWVRPIDSLEMRPVPGTDGVAFNQDQLFWSPDGASVAFVAQGKLKRVAVNGGPAQTIVDGVPMGARGAWGPNGEILLLRNSGAPIQRVSENGSVPVDVIKATDTPPRFPAQFLPDGKRFVYGVSGATAEKNGIYLASLDGGAPPKRLLADGSPVRYAPAVGSDRGGYLLFVRENTLTAQPFDPTSLALTGQPISIAQPAGRFSISSNGTLAYMSGSLPIMQEELIWTDRTGRQISVAAPTGDYGNFRLAPDNRSIVFDHSEDLNSDIWVFDLARGVPSRVTFDPSTDNLPIWSPDGRQIVWPSRRAGAFDLYIKAASGVGADERFVAMGTVNGWATDWSRDRRFVIYQRPGDKTGQDLWIAPQGNESSGAPQKPFPYLQSPSNEGNGVFSPDGRWIAYESDESGRLEVYVQAFPPTSEKVRVSATGGSNPEWNPNRAELFYLAADRNLMAVPYRTSNARFEAGVAMALFSISGTTVRRAYAVSADGRRFLVGKPKDTAVAEPLAVVLNWQSALKK